MSRFERSFIDQVLARTSITEVIGRKLIWDKKKSNPARGDMWACCPFHGEKSPSFHAQEDKGAYYCFGCQASGTAVDFLMHTENLGFTDAIKELAQKAGLEIPKESQISKEQLGKSERVLKALEEAKNIYQESLIKPEGKAAREYLKNRGIKQENWAQFGLGFSPSTKNFIKDKLTARGILLEDIIDAGLMKKSEDGSLYDYFRNRLMFPIEDASGKTISFGARTLEKDGMPKYLNGPESPVFSKGFTLYRYREARKLAKDKPIIIAEGYMDVIALELAGFSAVAPLGTALTIDQINLAWRAHNRPILCFDGDSAGVRAAGRALDRVLPLLTSLKTIGFAILPQGQDPDDIIKGFGRSKMAQIIENAQGLTKFLFEREFQQTPLEGPEQKANLRVRIKAQLAQIKDEDLKAEMKIEAKILLDEALGRNINSIHNQSQNYVSNGRGKKSLLRQPTTELKEKYKIQSAKGAKSSQINRGLLDILSAPIYAPEFLEQDSERFVMLDFGDIALDAVKNAVLDCFNEGVPIDFSAINSQLEGVNIPQAVEILQSIRKSPIKPFGIMGGDLAKSFDLWIKAIEKQEALSALENDSQTAASKFQSGEEEGFKLLTKLVSERRKIKNSSSDNDAY